jgi:glycosyltransferase involved in cell wall biosynthesis
MTHFPTGSHLSAGSSGDVRPATSYSSAHPRDKSSCSTEACASADSDLSAQPSAASSPGRPLKVLLWHWGQGGAGPKFTYELGRELLNQPDLIPTVSASAGSELAMLAGSQKGMVVRTVRTFEGNKTTWIGKLRAARGVLGLWQLGRDFAHQLCEQQADIALCTFQSIWDLAAIPALRRWPKPFILILHDATFHPGDYYPFRELVLRWEINCADALIVLSDHVGRAAQKLFDFPADRIRTVKHGAFPFGSGDVRMRTFPHSRPVRLLFLGRIVKYKGLDLLLDAYSLLRARGAAVELDIVGSGDLGPHKAQLSKLMGISIINKWLDEEEIAKALARADLVVLPYIEASQSGVAASALAAAVPIVATPVGGLVEQVSSGRTGIIANGMQTEDLATAIQRFIRDPALYETCSAGALEYARSELGWPHIAAEIAAFVQEVARRPRRRGPC